MKIKIFNRRVYAGKPKPADLERSMEESMTGYLAYSLSGHDKGRVYLIMKEDQDYAYLADGDVRTADKLKKKNKKHIQVIKKTGKRTDLARVTNEEIKYQIKQYCKGIQEVE